VLPDWKGRTLRSGRRGDWEGARGTRKWTNGGESMGSPGVQQSEWNSIRISEQRISQFANTLKSRGCDTHLPLSCWPLRAVAQRLQHEHSQRSSVPVPIVDS